MTSSPTVVDINANEVAQAIVKAAAESKTEEDVKIRVEFILRTQVFDKLGIPWAFYEYTLVSGIRPDALYGHLIIEYEEPRTLDKPAGLEHAIDQLKGYIADEAETEARFHRFFGVTMDGHMIAFLRYRAHVKTWDVKGPYEVNRYTVLTLLEAIRGLAKKPLTADLLVREFGPETRISRMAVGMFYEKLTRSQSSKTKVLYEDWERVFSHVTAFTPERIRGIEVAYGIKNSIDPKMLFFAIHSYYALVMKFLAAEVATLFGDSLLWSYLKRLEDTYHKGPEALRQELTDLEEGGIFAKLRIKNFLEADYFAWYLDEWDSEVADAITEVARKLGEFEPATAELERETVRDLFKELYENLVSRDVRHNLGEYYTPDWLAELLLEEAGLTKEKFDEIRESKGTNSVLELRILDPACGSGTFLAEAISRMREFCEDHFVDKDFALEKIAQNVVGFDLNPLAVLTARANYLLAIGEFLRYRRTEVDIPVYLADSALIEKRATLEGDSYVLSTVVGEFLVPSDVVQQGRLNGLLTLLEERVVSASREAADSKKRRDIMNTAIREFKVAAQNLGLSENETRLAVALFENLLKLDLEGKNKVWARIIKNGFAPLLKGKFDYVVGNPPWLSYRYVGSVKYQDSLKKLIIDDYGLTKDAELVTHIELAALFFTRCADLYLVDGGILAFVMPRAILYSDHHDKLRRGAYARIKMGITGLIDAGEVDPLFNVPACAVTSRKGSRTEYPIRACVVKGILPRKNMTLSEALPHLKVDLVEYGLYELGSRSWVDIYDKDMMAALKSLKGKRSHYYGRFSAGAEINPRTFWFVEISAPRGLGLDIQRPHVKTSTKASLMSADEYKKVVMEGNVESRFLYGVVTGSEIVPFGAIRPCIAVLPIVTIANHFRLVSPSEASRSGAVGLARWIKQCENEWKKARGEKSGRLSVYENINYQGDLTEQNPRARFKVFYPASATYVVSTVVDTHDISLLSVDIDGEQLTLRGVIADKKTFYFETDDENEAYYISAVLNSKLVDETIKPMQTKGKFGPRDIHKKVLELPIPRYDGNKALHKKLSQLGKVATSRVKNELPSILHIYQAKVLTPQHIARIRAAVRDRISDMLGEIDVRVIELFEGVSRSFAKASIASYAEAQPEPQEPPTP